MMDYLEKSVFLKNMESILKNTLGEDTLSVQIDMNTNLVNGIGTNCLNLSSIDYVYFIVDVENLYDMAFDFDAQVFTLNDVYEYIKNYKIQYCGGEK